MAGKSAVSIKHHMATLPKMALEGPQTGVLGHLFGGSRGGHTKGENGADPVSSKPLVSSSGWSEICVFHVFGGYRPAKTTINLGSGRGGVRISCIRRVSTRQNHYNYMGLGGAMSAFHVLGGHQPAQTTIIIGVWGARCANFTCLKGIDQPKPL